MDSPIGRIIAKMGVEVGRVADKVALVTGVGHPLAAAAASALADEGARLVVVDTEHATAERAAAVTGLPSPRVMSRGHERSSETAWGNLVTSVIDRFGRLDILVNGPPDLLVKPIREMTLSDLRALEEANIVAPWLGMKHATVAMRAGGGGSIVNLSLGLARTGAADLSGNCATAAGLRVMSQAVALECGQNADGIRVNSILVDHARPPAPAEVAAAVVYLASDESRFMTAGEIAFEAAY